MFDILGALYYHWDVFLLLFLRVSGLIFNSPVFGRQNIPQTAKIGYCAVIAAMFYISIPQVNSLVLEYNDDLFTYILLCVTELLFGMILGFVLNLFMTIAFTAGQVIDMQMGFGMVNVMDVQGNLSVPVSGNLLNIVILIVFFTVDGHLRLIEMLYNTMYTIPLGEVAFDPEKLGWVAMKLFVDSFTLAAVVAMPVIGSGLLAEICFGILMRVVPQMNAFSIGMPIKIVLGFLVLVAVMQVYVPFCTTIITQMFQGMDQMFATLAAG
ncbi:flagellar type III secretion system protein FliR [Christensenellaceae bacterium OttesenSCG-928-K19]|nr:flagellar type III secretion system protein FliR [Christensenellaceae bacterium OttesenSCG-928-K19]